MHDKGQPAREMPASPNAVCRCIWTARVTGRPSGFPR